MSVEHTGWLLDAYADRKQGGIGLWMLSDRRERLFLRQAFPIAMYAAGNFSRLRSLWGYLEAQPIRVSLARVERWSLFEKEPLTAMKIQVEKACEQPRLFADIKQSFPDLDYYDADIPLLARYAAKYDVFPLTRCRAVEGGGWIQEIIPLESRWKLDPEPLPLRILSIEPDTDPAHAPPSRLTLQYGRCRQLWNLKPERPLLVCLESILRRYDPDLILTGWGDTWLLPHLLELSRRLDIPLSLNRDPNGEITHKKERTFYTYGSVVHRGEQVLLAGRMHIDVYNAMVMYRDYGLEGVFELARVSGLPAQVAARNSPGSGITAMQVITALKKEILVPYHKQQTEGYKTAFDLIGIDKGGLVGQPLIGLFSDVAEIDFVSMYPSIIRQFNISPETTGNQHLDADFVRQLGTFAARDRPGLVPETLAPLLDKRITLKQRLMELDPRDCRYKPYKARSTALKWLLVVCFGYTGYKNAKFGKIEAHEAITAYAREALLRAKEAAEDFGFTVLHFYVDGLWIQKPGAGSVADFQPVLDEIVERTGLPIALDGIYKWVAFLPSRQDSRVPVPNRYFGVFKNGEIKVRGIEARRGDTPGFIAQAQMDILQLLAKAPDAENLSCLLPEVVGLLRKQLKELQSGRLNVERLLVRQKLSHALNEYRVPSSAARAAKQLQNEGKTVHVGQSIRLLYVRGKEKVSAWDLSAPPDPATLDTARYKDMLLRAAGTLLEPLGVEENALREWLLCSADYPKRPGLLPRSKPLL